MGGDVGTGPGGAPHEGWWLASDGQWYPPEQHPDAVAREEPDPGPVPPGAGPAVVAPDAPVPGRAAPGRGRLVGKVAAAVVVVVLVGAALVLSRGGDDEPVAPELAVGATDPRPPPEGTRPPGSTAPTVPGPPGSTVPAVVPGAPGVLAERMGDVGTFSAPSAWFSEAGATEPSFVVDDDGAAASVGSPDGRYVARSIPADATTAGSWEILETDTGELVLEVPYEAPTSTSLRWALDSSAFAFLDGRSLHLQRLEGGAATAAPREGLPFELDEVAFSSDDRTTALVACPLSWVFTLSLDGTGTYTDPDDTMGYCSEGEALDPDGRSVALYSFDGAVQRLEPDGSSTPIRIQAAEEGEPYAKVIDSCRGSILVNDREGHGVVVAGSDEVAIVDGRVRGSCPLLAPDRASAAWWAHQQPGPVGVADVRTGAYVEVARIGSPVSWSADSRDLLVLADSLFVVAADGSGGDEIDPSLASSKLTRWCRLGTTGLALVGDGRSLALVDVGGRAAAVLDTDRSLDGHCATTDDGAWALVGRLVIDLDAAEVHELAPHRLDDGARTMLTHFRWRDAHERTGIGDAGLYRSSD